MRYSFVRSYRDVISGRSGCHLLNPAHFLGRIVDGLLEDGLLDVVPGEALLQLGHEVVPEEDGALWGTGRERRVGGIVGPRLPSLEVPNVEVAVDELEWDPAARARD